MRNVHSNGDGSHRGNKWDVLVIRIMKDLVKLSNAPEYILTEKERKLLEGPGDVILEVWRSSVERRIALQAERGDKNSQSVLKRMKKDEGFRNTLH